jgi:hypothetical protein
MKRSNYLLKTIGVCSLMVAGSLSVKAQGVAMEWAKQMNSNSDNSMGMGITNDAAGNVYVTGRFGGTVDFDPGPNTFNMTASGITDVFVTKMDPAGNLIWAKQWGSASTEIDQGVSIAVDAAGNVYSTGIFGGNTDFDPGTGTSFLNYAGGWSDIYISKLDASGNFVWAKAIGGLDADASSNLVLDGSGHIFLAGSFSGTVDFDPGTGVSNMTAANAAGFVAKLDTAGALVWARQFSGAGSYLMGNIAVAPSGNMYVMGSVLDNTVDLDPGTGTFNVTPLGFIDAVVMKLNSEGNFVWAKQMGGIFSLSFGLRVALDPQEHVLNAGVYAGDIDFDPGTGTTDLTSGGSEEYFFSKLDSAGNFIWAKGSAGSGSSVAETYALTVDKKGNLYAAGFLNNTVDFDPGAAVANLTTATTAAFMMKLDSAGNYKWAKEIAGSGIAQSRALSIDASGNVYSTGNFRDTCDFDPNLGISKLMSTVGKDAIYVHKMVCSDTSSSVMEKSVGCEGFTFNNVTYTHSGTYNVVLTNQDGCDSNVVLNLQVESFVVAITATGFNLSAAQTYSSYKWMLNGALIPGATTNAYTVTQNGQYQLIGSSPAGCIDTSDVYSVTNYTGIDDVNGLASQIKVYPNPANDLVFVNAPVKVNLTLTDVTGKAIITSNTGNNISVKGLASGMYLLRITDKNGVFLKTEKLLKGNK